MTFRLGLTGSIGMGKSTASRMFSDKGIPIWDADEAVHRLYAEGGAAVGPVAAIFPQVQDEKKINRKVLKLVLAENPVRLAQLEEVVHPLIAADRDEFLYNANISGTPIAVFDIPLLFETGADINMDGVAVVSTDLLTQRNRVLSRPGMSKEIFDIILKRQMPDKEKRKRADWIIPSDTLESAQTAVDAICNEVFSKF